MTIVESKDTSIESISCLMGIKRPAESIRLFSSLSKKARSESSYLEGFQFSIQFS